MRAEPATSGPSIQQEKRVPRPDVQIERTIARAMKFLGTLSRNGQIRSALERGGYNADEHSEGWSLLLELLGYSATSPQVDTFSSPSSDAMNELDQWDGPNFARARAALEHKHPEQAAYVFAGLTAKTAAESVAAVQTFLDRVATLRKGSDAHRKAWKADDKAAAALLAERQILDAATEAHLRTLIKTATTLASAPSTAQLADAASPEARLLTAASLEAWLSDWRETARVLITRRDYHISLGLAQRRAPAGGRAVDEGAEVDGDGEADDEDVATPQLPEAATLEAADA